MRSVVTYETQHGSAKKLAQTKWICSVCGYVHTGEEPPAQCPTCKPPASVFKKL